MDSIIRDIVEQLRASGEVTDLTVERTVRAHNRGIPGDQPHHTKKKTVAFYLKQRAEATDVWKSWAITPDEEQALAQVLRMKPRRTASGVATITVITKPWKCISNCLYCPNDVRMPKSYLTNEPACQRAERNYFDPYLQIASRLRALTHMGHTTDKVELIVLGGTWSDYPQEYQIWFAKQLFKALNDAADWDVLEAECARIRASYAQQGVLSEDADLHDQTKAVQQQVTRQEMTYNQAIDVLYAQSEPWQRMSAQQVADWPQLEREHDLNVNAAHRVVGFVVETRPDTITPESLSVIRRLGCTKVQMGIQSLDPAILKANCRDIGVERIARAFELLRLFGFKTHVHTMLNLLGATPERDKADYLRLVGDPAFKPDEVKLYPCALVDGTGLCAAYQRGDWRPYTEEELMEVLVEDTFATPPYTRISRMIRDISAQDIMVGNKKTNLRQMVESAVHAQGRPFQEIRLREISTGEVHLDDLRLDVVEYETTVSRERFLQWVTAEGGIAGFLRLSLPLSQAMGRYDGLPVQPDQAMIREVHVYGKVAGISKADGSAQHSGLGRTLVETACDMARQAGYGSINVISSVGTRAYYARLGFEDAGLYQRRAL